MPVDSLRTKISRAFERVSYPSTVAEMLAEPYRSSDDAYEMAAALHGKPWNSVPVLDLFRHREMLFAMSPAAYAAYLPAYLTACLATEDPFDKYGADLREATLESLAAAEDASSDRRRTTKTRLDALTKPQHGVAVDVVEHLKQRWSMPRAQQVLDALAG